MKRILLAGEAMGLFIAGEEGSLSDVSHFSSAIAGAEYNVAVDQTMIIRTPLSKWVMCSDLSFLLRIFYNLKAG